jgi:tetratricopeptide (TPR) repeat protein
VIASNGNRNTALGAGATAGNQRGGGFLANHANSGGANGQQGAGASGARTGHVGGSFVDKHPVHGNGGSPAAHHAKNGNSVNNVNNVNNVNSVTNVNSFSSFGWGGLGFGYAGWGFGPAFGYGFGSSLGYGLGLGLGGGLFGAAFNGSGGYGYGGYGGYRGGYYPYSAGYGNGYAYTAAAPAANQSGGYDNAYSAPASLAGIPSNAATAPGAAEQPATTAVPPAEVVSIQPKAAKPATDSASADRYAEKGEAAFRAGDYKGAVSAWRHAAVDDPKSPLVVMLLGQALFATGNYDEAAGATQAAMQMLDKEQWGVVVGNYKDLYGNCQDYTDQLRALEKAVSEEPKNPARRFLAGYHYAYLGYPEQAINQLEKGLAVAPNDEVAKRLRDEMRTKLTTSEKGEARE